MKYFTLDKKKQANLVIYVCNNCSNKIKIPMDLTIIAIRCENCCIREERE